MKPESFLRPPDILVAELGCQLRPCPKASPSTSLTVTFPFREAFPPLLCVDFQVPLALKPKERKADFRD